MKAVEEHRERLGQVPNVVAADAAFHSPINKLVIEKMGVKYISVPNSADEESNFTRDSKDTMVSKGPEVAKR